MIDTVTGRGAHGAWIMLARRVALAVVLLGAACAPDAPRRIVGGEDACDYCHMEIADARFAAQVVTATGKVHVFDSVECLAGFLARAERAPEPRQIWVADVESPGTWVRAEDAGYLIDASVRSPMGRVIAFATPTAADAARARVGGNALSWQAIRDDSAGVVAHHATTSHGAH